MNKIAVILLLLCSAAAFALKPPHPSSKHRPVVSEQRPQKVSCSAPIPKPQVTKTESLPLVALNDDVAWTSLRELQEINNPKEGEGYPWISGDGLRIYFTHGKESGNSIVFTQRASLEHPFSKPIALPFRFGGIISCWLTPDEKDIYISTRNAVYTAHRASNSTSFAEATPLSIEGLPTKHTGGVSFSADASEMFLMLSQDILALGIAQCERTEKGSYRYVRTIKAPEGFYTGFGHLSKDGLSLYFSASYKGGSPVLYSLKRERLRDSFELQSFRRVGGLPKAIATRLNQPCVSDNLQWMVFVGGEVNRWDSNQLYLVQRIHDKPVYSPSTHTAPTDEVVATQQHQAAAAAIAAPSLRELQEINNPEAADAYPWISGDGLRLYYTNSTGAESRIVFAQRATTQSPFAKPIVLPFDFWGILSCWLTPDEKDIFISTYNEVYTAHRSAKSASFGKAKQLTIEGVTADHLGGISFSADASQMFIMIFQNNMGVGIAQCMRTEKGSYTYVRTITPPQDYIAGAGHLSKDGLSLYFSASLKSGKKGNSALYTLKRESLSNSFDVQSFRRLGGLFEPTVKSLIQPCVSNNLEWMVFVCSDANNWKSNQLYIVQNTKNIPTLYPETATTNPTTILPTQQPETAATLTTSTPEEEVIVGVGGFAVEYGDFNAEGTTQEQNTERESNNDATQATLHLYPNPATEYITLSLNTKAENAVVEILSLEGKVLQRQLMNNNQLRLSVQGLNSGTYWLRLTTASGTQTQKFIRQ